MANEENPYVGPRPFDRPDHSRFFGRERETQELFSLVVASKLSLVYAASGAGKTSLLNAGLIPVLEEEEHFEILPVARIRGLDPDELAGIENAFAHSVVSNWRSDLAEPPDARERSLEAFLRTRPHPVTPQGLAAPRAIIFDQFEEIFTAYPERWEDRGAFLKQIADALKADALLRVVLAIRDDFLARLETDATPILGALRGRFRLDRLRVGAALEAVEKPLQSTTRSFAPGAAKTLVDDLLVLRIDRGDGSSVEVPGEFIEPVQLQVVCQRLWSELPPEVTEITEHDLQAFGNVDEVLGDLYDGAVRQAAVASGTSERDLREWIGKTLITSGGTRGTAYRDAAATADIPNTAIDELERHRLIRAEYRAGARWYELTHDRLIGPIRASNEAFFATAASTRRKRLLIAAAVVGAAAIVATVAALVLSRGRANDAEARAAKLDQAASIAQTLTTQTLDSGPGTQQIMAGAFVTGRRFTTLAVGFSRQPAEQKIPAIWMRDTRGGWHRDGSPPPGIGELTGVAQNGAAVVAVGWSGPDNPTSLAQDAVVWKLSGRTWTRTCSGSDSCGAVPGGARLGQAMLDVSPWRDGFVAVGFDTEWPEGGAPNKNAAVWTSPDGSSWTRVSPGAASLRGPRDQEMMAVVSTGTGLVAVGKYQKDGAVWLSPDGERWTRVVGSPSAFRSPGGTVRLSDIAQFGTRLVAVGSRGDESGNRNEAAVLFSDDGGETWTRRGSPVFMSRGGGRGGSQMRGQQMRAVALAPFGLVAAGFDHPSGPTGPAVAALWTSLDGETWTAVSNPNLSGARNRELNDVLIQNGRTMIALGDGPALRPSDQDAQVWTATLK